ncbi:nuclear transport factor 2 family protein [Micromonospora sp. KC207]|uniref:nuclear transport factor 2 family protein n=1 Tax=Micromonospora sp. KC207 TaxID=2530377 RepID=UPI001FB59E64|nr:nuclear transport factor 2 family protein [Micromonospora sp. KC207]
MGELTAARTRAAVLRYLSALNNRDADAVAACVSVGFVNEHTAGLGRGVVGRAGYRERLDGFLAEFADLHYEVEELLVDGDRAALAYRMSFRLVSAGRAPVRVRGMFRFRVDADARPTCCASTRPPPRTHWVRPWPTDRVTERPAGPAQVPPARRHRQLAPPCHRTSRRSGSRWSTSMTRRSPDPAWTWTGPRGSSWCQRPGRASLASPRPMGRSMKVPSGRNSRPARPLAGGKGCPDGR